jgi:DNA-binding transcriptional regulator YhcF (GntR family)
MTKPMVRIHNLETDEIIDREMTDAEYAEYQADELIKLQSTEKAEADKAAAIAKLEALGLTTDDLKALGL